LLLGQVLLLAVHETIVFMNSQQTTAKIPDQPHHSCRQNRCLVCNRFFKPDPHVANQKYCSHPACQKQRKKINQANWVSRNPDYFKGRYTYFKEWRRENPNYQKEQRAKKKREIQDSCKGNSIIISTHLLITDKRLKVEIQDALRLQRATGRAFLIYGYPTRDTSLDSQSDTT
jgi:hypothetical protein